MVTVLTEISMVTFLSSIYVLLSVIKGLVSFVIQGKMLFNMSLVVRKPVFGISDQVRHKPGCTIKEDG